MNKYYLVLGMCDAYITSDWFRTKKAALACLDKAEGKSPEMETIEVDGTLKNVCFSDSEYASCKVCGKFDCEC